MFITIHLKVITKEASGKVIYPLMIDLWFYSVAQEMNFSALLTLYWAFARLKTSQRSAYFSTTGFITPCLAYPIPWQQAAFHGSTLRDVFMQTFRFFQEQMPLLVNLSPFCMMMFWASFHRWDEKKMYFPSAPVINLTSFSSKPTVCILLCNTGAGLSRLYFSLPAGLMLGFDNRSVGGTMQAQKRRVFSCPSGFQFFSVVGHRSGATTHQHLIARAGFPLQLNRGHLPPISLLPCCRRQVPVTTRNSP